MQWQRWLRIALGVFFVGLVVVLAFSMRSRKPAPAAPTMKRVDPTAAVELPQGADITWTQKGREAFTLQFTRGLSYPDGRYTFTGPHVTIPDRNGRTVDIRAERAELFAPTGQPRRGTFRGDVVLTSSDGLTLNTAEASYSEADDVLRIPGAFTFSRGRTSGSGRGAVYDQNADVLVIAEEARVKVAPAAGEHAMDIAAGTATMDRKQHIVRFERHAKVLSGTQNAEADTLVAYLAENNETLTRIELRGSSRVTDPQAAAGALRSMQAKDINLVYGPDGRTLQRAELRVGSIMEVAGSGAASKRLAADTIDASIAPDGQTLQQLNADQRVQLDIPAEGETPARRITSNALQGAGGPEGLRNATFTGAVAYRETQPARGKIAAVDRTARADRLDAVLKPGFGAPEAAVFRGRASVSDGDTAGEAGVIDYAPDKNLMTLETPAGTTGPTPRITDPQVTISAKWIELTLDPRKLNAKGDVKSVLKESGVSKQESGVRSQASQGSSRQQAGNAAQTLRPAPSNAHRRPAMLNDKDPVNVTAAALQYDAAISRGVYTGGARLWQGETTVQGETLTIDDQAGNLTAATKVRTRMMLEQINGKTKKKEMVESIGTSDDFVYEDNERRATYTGNAHLTGPQGDLAAKKIVLFLNEDGRTLNRAEAYDDVVARLEGGQQAFGARLTYFASDERYVMTGTPVKILEIVEGGCRETLGASLTFIRSTDTITVVGTEGNRSRTMPGRCAGSR
jgi:lipopolysaccharide export system protein LptA